MSETLDPKTLAEMTAQIVSAYVAHHEVAAAELPALIDAVAKRMGALGAEEAAPARPEPAVPVRRSVTPEHLICLICGKKVKILRPHLRTAHGLTPAAYREAFGLRADYPMTAPASAERRAEIARRIGLGRPRRPPAPEPAPARPRRRARGRGSGEGPTSAG